jgi:hypothetical protein
VSSVDTVQQPLTPVTDVFGVARLCTFSTAQTPVPSPPNNPIVSGQTPAPGSAILPTMPISFTVSGIEGPYMLGMRYPSGDYEVIWDGLVFAPFYIGASTVTAPGSSQTFSVLRTGGWLQAPTVSLVTGF